MKHLNKTALLLAVCWSALLVAGCEGPRHTVISSKSMVVYHAEERKTMDLGKYEYWVRDNSSKGWTLITDDKFQVGDTLVITKSNDQAVRRKRSAA